MGNAANTAQFRPNRSVSLQSYVYSWHRALVAAIFLSLRVVLRLEDVAYELNGILTPRASTGKL